MPEVSFFSSSQLTKLTNWDLDWEPTTANLFIFCCSLIVGKKKLMLTLKAEITIPRITKFLSSLTHQLSNIQITSLASRRRHDSGMHVVVTVVTALPATYCSRLSPSCTAVTWCPSLSCRWQQTERSVALIGCAVQDLVPLPELN